MKKSNLSTGTVYLTISSLVFLITGYVINIFLGRSLGPVAYGIYGIVISLVSYINIIQTNGLTQSISKYLTEIPEKQDSILKSGLIIQLSFTITIALFFSLAAPLLANALHDESLIPYFRISAFIFPFYGLYALYIDYYNGLHNFSKQALLNMTYSVAKVFFVLLLALFFRLNGVFLGFIFAPIIPLIFGIKLPKRTTNFPIKKLLIFSLPIIGFSLFSTLLQSIDLFFVKSLLSSDHAPGYYTANQNIARVPYYGLSAISTVIFPAISHSINQNLVERTKRVIFLSLRFVLLLLIPSVVILSSTASQLLELLFSKVYIQGANSLTILVIGIGFLTIFVVFANILNGSGKPHYSFFISGIAVITDIVCCLFLIPKFGLSGAAIATTLSNVLAVIISFYFIYRRFTVIYSLKSLINIILSSFIILIVALIIKVPLLFLPIFYLILFTIYFALLIVLKEITKEDLELVHSLLPKFLADKIHI